MKATKQLIKAKLQMLGANIPTTFTVKSTNTEAGGCRGKDQESCRRERTDRSAFRRRCTTTSKPSKRSWKAKAKAIRFTNPTIN